eukprot:CAMPEP_0204569742 /NCGR_PEP_ID=MMETSP0661-20131031/37923_1 /ASSEMBLY_ACC=CAM_ASM_000606 /TAXON_ID=109239 /ORGANISM="Alexandrium margalefi, Strain AMGDE01CS-322" /LENGTH=50 /DNA_ID=CAMNT_0051577871 /DNA_START=78 /DNA_END=227 /DNA_ORIENTATION=-
MCLPGVGRVSFAKWKASQFLGVPPPQKLVQCKPASSLAWCGRARPPWRMI